MPRTLGDRDMEVIGIPLKKAGYYIVELASPRLGEALHGEKKPYYVSTSVLVTNLAVHFKYGRESSLVWVTTLDTAPACRIRSTRRGRALPGMCVYTTRRADADAKRRSQIGHPTQRCAP